MSANQYKTAFGESANVLGLAAVAAASAATLNPIPLLAGLVLEAGYLLFVPDTPWYRARLKRRAEDAVERQRQELKGRILPFLARSMQERYLRLEGTRAQIAQQSADDQEWFAEVLRKLDFLLEKFLVFADKQRQFDAYVRSVMGGQPAPAFDLRGPEPEAQGRQQGRGRRVRAARQAEAPPPQYDQEACVSDETVRLAVAEVQAEYDREITSLKQQIEQEQDANTKAVIEKRADVLDRRKQFVGRIGSILTNLNHQLGLVEDTFGLISDEIRARSPEQILADIEDVVYQTNSMTQVLDELASYEQLSARLGS